ncbi:MAG: hypothetical protein KJ971_08695 [Firmicutes bacterium]|nr:hypothetical protein [Bacillota bacterium]
MKNKDIVFELGADDGEYNDHVSIRALTRDGVWITLYSFKITEEMYEGYRVPLFLKIEYN